MFREQSTSLPSHNVATSVNSHDRVVCHCLRVTEGEIRQSIAHCQLVSVHGVMQHTGAGGGCTACHCRIKELIQQSAGQRMLVGAPEIAGAFGYSSPSPI